MFRAGSLSYQRTEPGVNIRGPEASTLPPVDMRHISSGMEKVDEEDVFVVTVITLGSEGEILKTVKAHKDQEGNLRVGLKEERTLYEVVDPTLVDLKKRIGKQAMRMLGLSNNEA